MIDIKTLVESKGLYMTTLPSGEQFTWRLLTLKEYKVFRSLREAGLYLPLFLYGEVFDYCYLGRADAINGNLPAGIFSSIGELIMSLSGDGVMNNEKEEIEIARTKYESDSVIETMKRIVLIAFSSYTPDDIECWTRQELFEKFTIAEAVLVNKGGYDPIDTKKIMTRDQLKKKQFIDFKKENEEMAQADPTMNKPHILDQHPDVLRKTAQKTDRLQKSQARELDRVMKRGK